MREKIVLVGGGGHCNSVIDVVEQQGVYDIVGIVDVAESVGKRVLSYNIIGSDNNLNDIFLGCENAIVTIGHIKSNETRAYLFEKLKSIGFRLPVIISPLAYVSKYASIGDGTVVMHHAIINANAKIGENCIINTKALVEHDCIIGNNCHISTAGILNGGVVVKDNSFFGSNATSKQNVEIHGFIKAGSLVK